MKASHYYIAAGVVGLVAGALIISQFASVSGGWIAGGGYSATDSGWNGLGVPYAYAFGYNLL